MIFDFKLKLEIIIIFFNFIDSFRPPFTKAHHFLLMILLNSAPHYFHNHQIQMVRQRFHSN